MVGSLRAVIDTVTIAANNGDIGGGEIMLLRIAEACGELGIPVRVVAPRFPSALAVAAEDAGFETVVLPAKDRLTWMRSLRKWDARQRQGLLWCNGLAAAAATTGHSTRVVHLHQKPAGARRGLAALARFGALATVVPSHSMLEWASDAKVLSNWTHPFPPAERLRTEREPFKVGFLGRLTPGKGITVLAETMQLLEQRSPQEYRLILGGEPLFIGQRAHTQVDAALAPVKTITDRCGWVRPEEFFHQIDVLVVPSILTETFGLVAAEAMAARVPVVVSDAGALPEVVGQEHGLIVPAGDPAALADRIADVAASDMGSTVDAQFRRWQDQFSPEAGLLRVRSLLEEIASHPRLRQAAPAARRPTAHDRDRKRPRTPSPAADGRRDQ